MSKRDRRLIASLLTPYFPMMEKASSDEWHGFLNAMTGLSLELDEPNATAFDKWRQALANDKSLPVWGISAEQAKRIQERGEELKRMEEARIEAQAETLAALRAKAPTKTAADLVKDANKAVK